MYMLFSSHMTITIHKRMPPAGVGRYVDATNVGTNAVKIAKVKAALAESSAVTAQQQTNQENM